MTRARTKKRWGLRGAYLNPVRTCMVSKVAGWRWRVTKAPPGRDIVNLLSRVWWIKHALGCENFVSRMCEFLGDKQESKEIPRAQRYPGHPSLDRFFADVPAGNRQQRNKRVMAAHITHGYTLKEIADRLGIHYTMVSKIVAGNRNAQ